MHSLVGLEAKQDLDGHVGVRVEPVERVADMRRHGERDGSVVVGHRMAHGVTREGQGHQPLVGFPADGDGEPIGVEDHMVSFRWLIG
ncbi:protein of unknown function [Candidatus Filomicrobium marinum]|uniref:Uncharacterized protein n=1 Tax=Candidatus Filomicrobium marinum TaxID=1608628 RepID=A0A0D6JC49_9HYPH|nr:protein of unknown function [Candidatus Filomicrobium marinum]CPR16038.1 protein of unknown function [Candidatus Filomicrobium marinum]